MVLEVRDHLAGNNSIPAPVAGDPTDPGDTGDPVDPGDTGDPPAPTLFS